MAVDLSARIPNNVELDRDQRLQRALEAWQPKYVEWWKEVGPVGFQNKLIYLRTAIDVGAKGWANFDGRPTVGPPTTGPHTMGPHTMGPHTMGPNTMGKEL